jgi:uridylate kinase
MDLTAATLCYDNNINIVVFDMGKSGNIKKVIEDPSIGTIITK